ncbi:MULTISPECIES: thioesterase family protein [unclassified Ruegeria]|uniref:acyl-CoA thioesterase n=1 Tax=unclassified Ruegeria TaxID=2625375 RepID=UPI001488F227|nr:MULTISPECIES: thioesterase family protein [unclassified Ruegeria]
MAFEIHQKVLFKHCDPAGIVFFPRYFEMMNDCVEAFFDEVLDHPFEALHKTGAVPTAQIETRFAAPSRHGDHLTLRLRIVHLGRTSARYKMTGHAGEALRFETTGTLVNVDAHGRPDKWPPHVAKKLEQEKEKLDAT